MNRLHSIYDLYCNQPQGATEIFKRHLKAQCITFIIDLLAETAINMCIYMFWFVEK